jgi:hypothetical protein
MLTAMRRASSRGAYRMVNVCYDAAAAALTHGLAAYPLLEQLAPVAHGSRGIFIARGSPSAWVMLAAMRRASSRVGRCAAASPEGFEGRTRARTVGYDAQSSLLLLGLFFLFVRKSRREDEPVVVEQSIYSRQQ